MNILDNLSLRPWKAVPAPSGVGRFTILDAGGNQLAWSDGGIANANVIAAAGELYALLSSISRAHESGNNGAVMGEAVLCEAFACRARGLLAKIESGKP